jgi:predicted transcriptional regulator
MSDIFSFRLSDEFRKEMDELSEKVAELYILKKQMAVRIANLV